jgi:hypothetical protein
VGERDGHQAMGLWEGDWERDLEASGPIPASRPGHKNRKSNTETEKTGTETEKTGTDQTVIFFGYHSSETEI